MRKSIKFRSVEFISVEFNWKFSGQFDTLDQNLTSHPYLVCGILNAIKADMC